MDNTAIEKIQKYVSKNFKNPDFRNHINQEYTKHRNFIMTEILQHEIDLKMENIAYFREKLYVPKNYSFLGGGERKIGQFKTAGEELAKLKEQLYSFIFEELKISCPIRLRKFNVNTYFVVFRSITCPIGEKIQKENVTEGDYHKRDFKVYLTQKRDAEVQEGTKYSTNAFSTHLILVFSNIPSEFVHIPTFFPVKTSKNRKEIAENASNKYIPNILNVLNSKNVQSDLRIMGNFFTNTVPDKPMTYDVLRKIKSQAKLNGRLSTCVIKDLNAKKLMEESDKKVNIRRVTTFLYRDSKKQISFEPVIDLVDDSILDFIDEFNITFDFLYFDATGSLMTDFDCPECELRHNSHRIFAYFGVVKHNKNTLPLYTRISSAHNYESIKESLQTFKKVLDIRLNRIPFQCIVTDWSAAAYNALCETFNEMSFFSYLDCLADNKFTLIKIGILMCCSHFVSILKKFFESENASTNLKCFTMAVFCVMINLWNFKDVEEIVENMLLTTMVPKVCELTQKSWSILAKYVNMTNPEKSIPVQEANENVVKSRDMNIFGDMDKHMLEHNYNSDNLKYHKKYLEIEKKARTKADLVSLKSD